MNIYVETNFVLELTFLQEQAKSCEQILSLGESGKANLIIPAYCLTEPHEKIYRQKQKRQEIQQDVNAEIKQLSRLPQYKAQIRNFQNLDKLFTQSVREERLRFETLRQRLLDIAIIITLDKSVLAEAAKMESLHNLSSQDALVYGSIITHLQTASSVESTFLNRNSKDFDTPDIRNELSKLNCKMIPRFDDGYNYITGKIKPSSP